MGYIGQDVEKYKAKDITSSDIEDGAVGTNDIGNEAVTFEKIKDTARNTSLYPSGFINGIIPSAGADTDHELSFTTGFAVSSDGTTAFSLDTALIKDFEIPWAVGTNDGGLFSGSTMVANSQYDLYVIYNPTADITDIGADLSGNGVSNLPSGYTKYKLITSFFTDGSANITPFTKIGNTVLYHATVSDVNTSGSGTSSALRELTVPTGRKVKAYIRARQSKLSTTTAHLLTSPSVPDEAVDENNGICSLYGTSSDSGEASGEFHIITDTSGRIRTRSNTSGATLYISTFGFEEIE